MPEATFEELIEAMKAGAGILQESGIPFILGGGLAAWARGNPTDPSPESVWQQLCAIHEEDGSPAGYSAVQQAKQQIEHDHQEEE